jgi:ribonuclease BN (tRNA processing enzyme)
MRVTLLGTGTSLPDIKRVQSGILVEQSDKSFLFDIGSGVLHRFVETGTDVKSLDSVFISHFHIDHSSDFMTLYQTLWLSAFDKTLRLYAPPPAREWFRSLNEAIFPYLRGKVNVEITELKERDVIKTGLLTVLCRKTLHGTMDSRAFRVEHGGRSLVISGDTAPCKEVIELATGADVLIHECNWLDGRHTEGVHTSPSQLAEVVKKAQPKKLILVHVFPEVVFNIDKVISTVNADQGTEVVLGEDMMTFNL